MASRLWSDEEIALVELHAPSNNWKAVASAVPDRTELAVKVRMTKRRRELGYDDARYGVKDEQHEFNAKAVIASQLLLMAIEQAGVRP